MVKFSIITCVKNDETSISNCLESVDSLKYGNFEHLVFDGQSTDQTLSIIQNKPKKYRRVISQHDAGLYDALNKAVQFAQGQYIILLHADDIFSSSAILTELDTFFVKKKLPDIVFCDIEMSDQHGNIVRRWKARAFEWIGIKNGWCPPHTGVVLSRKIYIEHLPYEERYRISADFDFLIRLLKENSKYVFLDKNLVSMSIGGMSTSIKNFQKMFLEDALISKVHKLYFWAPLLKRILKLGQLF